MRETFMLYLHEQHLEEPSWVVVNADGTVRQCAYRDQPTALSQIAEGKEVVVFVPTEAVRLTTVSLPNMNRVRLLQAVPFALEDEVIAEVETQHFALADHAIDDTWPVAIVSHHSMQQWLQLLTTWHVHADKMLPSIFALPHAAHTWYIAMLQNVVMVRTGASQGFSCEPSHLAAWLEALPASEQPKRLIITNATNHALQPTLEKLTLDIEEECVDTECLLKSMAQSHPAASINLLQGTYAPKKSRLPHMTQLRKGMVGLAAAFIGMLFLYPAISYMMLAPRNHALTAQIEQIYRRHFPNASSMVAPKLRMQEKLQRMSDAVGENHVLALLAQVGRGLTAASNVKLNRIDFQNGRLTMDVTAATSDDVSIFTNALMQQGLKVVQQNAHLVASRMNATLIIESEGV